MHLLYFKGLTPIMVANYWTELASKTAGAAHVVQPIRICNYEFESRDESPRFSAFSLGPEANFVKYGIWLIVFRKVGQLKMTHACIVMIDRRAVLTTGHRIFVIDAVPYSSYDVPQLSTYPVFNSWTRCVYESINRHFSHRIPIIFHCGHEGANGDKDFSPPFLHCGILLALMAARNFVFRPLAYVGPPTYKDRGSIPTMGDIVSFCRAYFPFENITSNLTDRSIRFIDKNEERYAYTLEKFYFSGIL